MASPHLAEQVGRVLDGRYRVVAPIGTGASAAVYLADDAVLRRRVAIKVLHAALAGDQGFLKRFQAEAHTAAGLSHPNIMRVLDWGEAGDGPFLVLEYLGGGSLRSVLDEHSLSVEQAVQVGIQAARALDYAHRRGLVHRDVKPANLLFDEEGRVAIADFGLARALAEAAWTEPSGAVLGTARYASPEQVRGRSLDGKADVYALALVLFEMVTGYVPFSADTTIATLMARLDAEVPLPDKLGALAPIIKAATANAIDDRIDAGTMAKQLDAAARQLPTPGRIVLPGAISNDPIRIVSVDPTMLPGLEANTGPVSLEARPLPPELQPKRRRLRRRRSPNGVDPEAANGKAKLVTVPEPQREKKKMRPALRRSLITLLTLILLGGVGSGTYYYVQQNEAIYPVPQLDGLTIDNARLAADTASIKLSVTEQYDENIPIGQVFGQATAVGIKVSSRDAVNINVSKGPAPREVSGVVGKNVDDAKKILSDAGFNVKTVDKNDEVKAKGEVLGQSPEGGLQPKGSDVELTVSSGPAPREIPNVKNMTQPDAVAAIVAKQLSFKVDQTFSDDVPAGVVASTSPATGAKVERGSAVTIYISKGPELVPVPTLSGLTVPQATAALNKAGMGVSTVFGGSNKLVFDTDPPAGTAVKKGSQIALYTR